MTINVTMALQSNQFSISACEMVNGRAYMLWGCSDTEVYICIRVANIVAFSICGSFMISDTNSSAFIEVDLDINVHPRTNY